MLGLFLIYFIGKEFYNLAAEFNKSKWGFAILGVLGYYIGTFLGGIILGLFYLFVLDKDIDTIGDFTLGLMALPFGILSCWGLYKLLQYNWRKSFIQPAEDILDANMFNE